MAQATHTPAVTRTAIVEVEPATITLVLSMEEAAAVLVTTGKVVGSRDHTMRKHTDSVYYSLVDLVDDLWPNATGVIDAKDCPA